MEGKQEGAPDIETIRETTDQVLNRPAFSEESGRHPLVGVVNQIGDWMEALSEWSATHPIQAWLLSGLLLLVLLALLAHLAYATLGGGWPWARDRGRPKGVEGRRWTVLEGKATSWHEAMAQAWNALSNGDHRNAVWLAHRVLLGILDEEGILKFAGWKTNGAYLAECPPRHPSHRLLQRLTELYERVIYRHEPMEMELVEGLLRRVDEVRGEPSR